MSILMDIIGASVIAGIIMLSILGLNTNLNSAAYNKTFSLVTQTNTVALGRMIEYDMVKMGYHTSKPALLTAKSDTITFMADLADAGAVNTIKYYMGPVNGLTSTKNPRDRMLYRVQDGNVIAMNLGLTSLVFSYFDTDGDSTATPSLVQSINVKFTVESIEPVDTTYSAAFWEKRIYPKNL